MFRSTRICSGHLQSFLRSRLGWHVNSKLRQTSLLSIQLSSSFRFPRPLYHRQAVADSVRDLTSTFYPRCLVHTSSTVRCNKVCWNRPQKLWGSRTCITLDYAVKICILCNIMSTHCKLCRLLQVQLARAKWSSAEGIRYWDSLAGWEDSIPGRLYVSL